MGSVLCVGVRAASPSSPTIPTGAYARAAQSTYAYWTLLTQMGWLEGVNGLVNMAQCPLELIARTFCSAIKHARCM